MKLIPVGLNHGIRQQQHPMWVEWRGLSVSDLVPFIGRPNRVYEVLSGKRGLSIQMIRRLHRGLGIPAEVSIAEPERA